MRFEREQAMGALGVTAYAAKSGRWGFLLIQDGGKWSGSYRLLDEHIPQGESVSAFSTMFGPFDDFADASKAAYAKLEELRRLS